MTIILKNYSCL